MLRKLYAKILKMGCLMEKQKEHDHGGEMPKRNIPTLPLPLKILKYHRSTWLITSDLQRNHPTDARLWTQADSWLVSFWMMFPTVLLKETCLEGKSGLYDLLSKIHKEISNFQLLVVHWTKFHLSSYKPSVQVCMGVVLPSCYFYLSITQLSG